MSGRTRFHIFSFREHVKLVAFVIIPTVFLPSCKMNEHAPKNAHKLIYVANGSEHSGRADYSDLNAAISSAPEQSRIICFAGTYIVDNPIVLKQKGIRVIGSGKGKTILVPKNVGKPVFRLQADDVRIERLGIKAGVENRSGRATFAILVDEGYGNCKIRNTKIQDTGASAIIGHAVNDCLIENNIIINSGDDAIQLRGHRNSVTGNILIGYFDEGIDVARGENISIRNNIVKSGRIGIVVDDSKDALIFGNVVEDHHQEGIVLGSDRGGIVENNIVIDSRGIAFHLHSPAHVRANVAAGENDVGLRIRKMQGGVVEENIIVANFLGIDFLKSSRNMVRTNRYTGMGDFLSLDKYGINYIYGNISDEGFRKPTGSDLGKSSIDLRSMISGNIVPEEHKTDSEYKKLMRRLSGKSDVPGNDVVVGGRSEKDRKHAESIANFLRRNNPGYLSVHIYGNTMTSKITTDLYHTLKGGGQRAIGLVRVPFLRFRKNSGSHFPRWHLYLNDEKVAVVYHKTSGANAKISFLDNGKLGLMDQLYFWKIRFLSILDRIKNDWIS